MPSRHLNPEKDKPNWFQSLKLLNFSDFLTSINHDLDFDRSRSVQIFNRLQAIATIYAIVGFFWLIIDYKTIPKELFLDLAAIRLFMVVGMLWLAVWSFGHKSLLLARIRLTCLVIIPTLFFVTSSLTLDGEHAEVAQLVYSFYPFVIVAQLAIFPLTFLEGLLLTLPAFLGIVFLGVVTGNSDSVQFLGYLILTLLLGFLAIWAEVSQLRMLIRLYRQATRDPLTGMFNRRLLMERVKEEEARFARSGNPMSLMIIDLDKFKRVNDNYGHLVGDKVLERFAIIAKKSVRAEDIVGRYGGEEFMVVLPNTNLSLAQSVAERIRLSCESDCVFTDEDVEVKFSVSIGVAQLNLGETGNNALERADTALYTAKESGRNRVELAKN